MALRGNIYRGEVIKNPTDEEIKEILKRARNIAVVGLSDKPGFILAEVGQGGIARLEGKSTPLLRLEGKREGKP